jgi:DNA-directed RNA polymerase subunit RPC12/RpoP
LYRKMVRKPKPRVVREHKCLDCDTMITQTGKGRTVLRCQPCKTKLRAEQNATYRETAYVPLERPQTCTDCGCDMGIKTGRGKLKQRCDDCQKKNHNRLARESAKRHYKSVVRKYTCATCNNEFEQTGRGKLRKTCPECKGKLDTSNSLDNNGNHMEFLQTLMKEKEDQDNLDALMWEGMQ